MPDIILARVYDNAQEVFVTNNFMEMAEACAEFLKRDTIDTLSVVLWKNGRLEGSWTMHDFVRALAITLMMEL